MAEPARFTQLMRPPAHAPVTPFDTGQTGITPQMVATRPPASEVLAELDAWFTCPQPWLLVAHHAPTEAAVLYNYRQHCPRLAATHLLDPVRLARPRHPRPHPPRPAPARGADGAAQDGPPGQRPGRTVAVRVEWPARRSPVTHAGPWSLRAGDSRQ